MKLTGFLLLVAGWVIVATAAVLLPAAGARMGFVFAGLAVEVPGLYLAVRSHIPVKVERG